jgi:hypothetical protein
MRNAFLQLNVILFTLLCVAVASCTDQDRYETKAPHTRQILKGHMDTIETKAPHTRQILKGHMDSVEGKAIWICDNSAYEANVFDHSRSEYASVVKMDADRNPLAMGLINRKGEIMVPIIYDGLGVGFTDGLCQVHKGNKLGLVNLEGREIVAPQYKYIDQPVEGLFRVGKDEKYGIMNMKGEIVIPVMYAQVEPAKEGMIAFMKEPQRWGYLNLKNEIVIKPEFTFSAAFKDGKVILQKPDGEDYIVYKDGRVEKK